MKKLIFIIPFFLFCKFAQAQDVDVMNDVTFDDRPVHFGFTIGVNTMDFLVKPTQFHKRDYGDSLIADVVTLQPGFHVSAISDFRLNEYFHLRILPGLSFGERILKFSNMGSDQTQNHEMKIESSFVEIPVLMRYKAKRIVNFNPYIITGFNFRYDISSHKGFSDEREVYVRLNAFDIAYEAGLGFDFYMPYFKLALELKLSTGLLDVMDHTEHPDYPQYVNSIESLKSTLVMFSIHFE